MMIIDECHILGADTFLQILKNFCKCNYIFALSGTPDRQDNQHVLYYNYFDKLINLPIKQNVDIEIQIHLINNSKLV